mmetsp:Transcript_19101/g.35356  ORF Transcript_19101/g.35356 Transcript_19101/m.35356 type:complete len:83 (+) Transcript_19101:3-251(+)
MGACFVARFEESKAVILSSPGARQQLSSEISFLRNVLGPYELEPSAGLAAVEAELGGDTDVPEHLIEEMTKAHQIVAMLQGP